MKDIKQAEADFTRSLELDPSHIHSGWLVKWTEMCQRIPDSDLVERLEKMAAIDPDRPIALICRGTAKYLQRHFEEALAELARAIQLEPGMWNPYFWKGIVCASMQQDEDAIASIEKALELGLPPVLLAPLRWLEQDSPDFYQKFVVPLFARYELTG